MTTIPPPAQTLNSRLLEQLTFHWVHHVRPHLDGLTDDEYFWEPVSGCWSIRRRGEATTSGAAGAGEFVADYEWPEPDPAPVTTIAWRLAHITIGCFGMRNANHFGGPPIDYFSAEYPGTAKEALAALDDSYEGWVKGVTALGDDGLERKVGDVEGPYAEHSYADLVLHIHREVIHHSAEILLLRDLYRSR